MIKIYGKPDCSYCESAKKLLDAKGIPYSYLTLGVDYVTEDVKALAPNARTFPVIIVDGAYIGGFAELRAKIGLIEQAGVGNGPTFLSEEQTNV